jgi:MFS family permease
VAPEHRPRAFALLYWVINLGVAVAGVTGGLLAERSFWLLFVLDAATCLAFAVLIARKVPETRPPRDPSRTAGYAQALGDPLLLGLSASTLLGATVYMQSLVTLPLAVEADGLGPDAFGLIYAVNPIVVIVAQVFVLRIIDRIAGVRILVVALVVMGVGFWMTTFASTVPTYALTVVVWTIGEVGFNAIEPALVADIAPPDLRGRYNGVVGMSYGAAALLGPLLGTRLFEDYGETVLWTACLLASLVSAALIAAMAPSIARRRAAIVLAPLPSQP